MARTTRHELTVDHKAFVSAKRRLDCRDKPASLVRPLPTNVAVFANGWHAR